MNHFSASENWLSRAERTIPLGSQTFSKSRTQYPLGISPLFTDKAKGANIWDVDGNKYIDLVNALGAVTIGYRNSRINKSIKSQMKNGITFSLPSRLEAVLAEKISEIIPSAEKVRFGKTGTDSTSAAIRIARAYTGRDHVITCGYHGWQDWSIGVTTKNNGVPLSVSQLSHPAIFNDLESFVKIFENFPNQISCVILEPMTSTFPTRGFLQELQNLCHNNGALLIFDETVTGFRFSLGGAQAEFGVLPDLSTFGKGMANGMPISMLVGKKEFMNLYEDVFISGTFGGETLSIAAALACIEIFEKENVQEGLALTGKRISEELQTLLLNLGLSDALHLSGHDSWKFLIWQEYASYSSQELKTLFMQEAFQEGLLVLNTHNLSHAINYKISSQILNKYEKILNRIAHSIRDGRVLSDLKVSPLKPLFSVRN